MASDTSTRLVADEVKTRTEYLVNSFSISLTTRCEDPGKAIIRRIPRPTSTTVKRHPRYTPASETTSETIQKGSQHKKRTICPPKKKRIECFPFATTGRSIVGRTSATVRIRRHEAIVPRTNGWPCEEEDDDPPIIIMDENPLPLAAVLLLLLVSDTEAPCGDEAATIPQLLLLLFRRYSRNWAPNSPTSECGGCSAANSGVPRASASSSSPAVKFTLEVMNN